MGRSHILEHVKESSSSIPVRAHDAPSGDAGIDSKLHLHHNSHSEASWIDRFTYIPEQSFSISRMSGSPGTL